MEGMPDTKIAWNSSLIRVEDSGARIPHGIEQERRLNLSGGMLKAYRTTIVECSSTSLSPHGLGAISREAFKRSCRIGRQRERRKWKNPR
jgi:hypothetical protein